MKKRDSRKTLRLGREVVRNLSNNALAAVVGGVTETIGQNSCVPATSAEESCFACQ